jgi:hypothetical protein
MMNMKLWGRGETEGPQREERFVMFWMSAMSHRLLNTWDKQPVNLPLNIYSTYTASFLMFFLTIQIILINY